jgi:hypothetical protein
VKQLESIKNKIKSFYPSNTTIYKKMNHENIYKEKYDIGVRSASEYHPSPTDAEQHPLGPGVDNYVTIVRISDDTSLGLLFKEEKWAWMTIDLMILQGTIWKHIKIHKNDEGSNLV